MADLWFDADEISWQEKNAVPAAQSLRVNGLVCHGAEGISAVEIYPNLAGQKAAYVVSQLKAFKAGERNNAIMAPMAMPLSDQDMEDLAAYYASL